MKNYESLNDMEKDVLREIGNIGGGNAATALSDILSDRVDMTVPKLSIINVSDVAEILGGPENEVVGVLVTMSGDISGMLLLVLDKHFTKTLVKVLLEKDLGDFSDLDDMDLSALKEIGNILSSSYVNAMSAMTDLRINLSPPDIAIDMVGAILSYPASVFGMMGDKVLYIEDELSGSNEKVKSNMLIMPDIDSLERMLKCLGVV